MTVSLDQLRAAIQQQTAAVAQFVADVQALITKIPGDVDYSNELTAVNASIAALQNADATVKAAIPSETPPQEPAPAPAEATPVADPAAETPSPQS